MEKTAKVTVPLVVESGDLVAALRDLEVSAPYLDPGDQGELLQRLGTPNDLTMRGVEHHGELFVVASEYKPELGIVRVTLTRGPFLEAIIERARARYDRIVGGMDEEAEDDE